MTAPTPLPALRVVVSRCLRAALAAAVFGGVHLPARAQCPVAAGCTPGNAPAANRVYGMGLYRVELAGLVDTTAAGAGYRDYSCRPGAQLRPGTTYTLQVTTNGQADETVRAWLDLNGDGAFTPNELVLASTGRHHRGSVVLPSTVPAGAALRLRIAADYANAPVPGPCTTPQYSQTADYRVAVANGAPAPPRALFTAVDSVSCSGTVAFRDQSTNAPTAWRWAFGDGTASTTANPVHTYAAPGTYAVRLRACNAAGCDSLSKPAYVTVRGDGPRPAACRPATQAYCCDFGLVRVRGAGLDHRPGGGAAGYQDASCTNRAALMADWPDTLRLTTGGRTAHDVRVYADLNDDGRFDPATELLYDGRSVIDPAVPVRISSLSAGLVYGRALRLRLWADYAGSPGAGPCADPERGQVVDYALTIAPNTRTPHAAFTLAYAQPCGPVRVAVANASQGNAAVRWDFGDGSASTAADPPVHTYPHPGAYTIRLVAANGARTDSARQEIAVAAACPSYCASDGWGGNEDSPVYFTRVALADVDNQSYRAPRVGYRDYTGYVATVRQGQAVPLRTESLPFSSGGTGPWVRRAAWVDFNQDGQFGPSEQVAAGSSTSPFLDTLRIPANAPLGATRLRLMVWVLNSPAYTNTCSPAAYSLSATEDYTLVVLPRPAPPRAGFTADLPASCSGQVQFRDTTWYAPTAWRWDFGDGSGSTDANPRHAYAQPGTYSVALRTANVHGTSTATRPAYVTVTALGQGPRPAAVALSTRRLAFTYGMAQAQLAALAYTNGDPDPPGYRDESCRQAALRLAAGGTYPVVVTGTPRNVGHLVYLWLDANDDGVFDQSERVYALPAATPDRETSGTFTVPPTALPNRPLRLRLYWHGLNYDDDKKTWPAPDPQTRDEDYDQVRDFTVWVGGDALATAPAGPLTSWYVYPNPTTGLLTIAGLRTPQVVIVRNVLGQIAWQGLLTPNSANTAQVTLNTLAKGIYFVQLITFNQSKKLIIN